MVLTDSPPVAALTSSPRGGYFDLQPSGDTLTPEAHGGSNGNYGGPATQRTYIPPPQPGAAPTPLAPVFSELATQSQLIEQMGGAMARLESMADSALRQEVDPPGTRDAVEKKPVESVGTSILARSVNDRSNELAYLLRRMTRLADRLET